MALEYHENDERVATLTIVLAAIMSVICTGAIVAAVLSMDACSV